MVFVFYTQEGIKYKGRALYYRYIVKQGLNKDQARKLFYDFYKKFGRHLLAIRYNPNTGVAVVFVKKSERLIPLAVVIPLVSLLGGAIVGFLVGAGEIGYSKEIVPGFSLSLWDIIKFGALAFIIAGLVKTAVDAYVALKRKEYLPTTPYEVFVQPIERPVKEVVRAVTPYIVKR